MLYTHTHTYIYIYIYIKYIFNIMYNILCINVFIIKNSML